MLDRRHRFRLSLVLAASILGCMMFCVGIDTTRAEVTLDGSLGPRGPVSPGVLPGGVPTTYLISDNLGRRAGSNLFHSFDKFNISTGESATFTGPGDIANIISRVTGGSLSSIDGILRSTIDGANLFLMNPAGVMFGPNASLDVRGSFHVTTADYLKFGDGSIFYANPNLNSVLSIAAPEAFGFLTSNPAPITVDRTSLRVPDGKTLSVVGGDLTFVNDPSLPTYYDYDNYVPGPTYYVLNAPLGRINVVSAASPGEVNLNAPDLGAGSFARLGNISFSNGANLNVSCSDYVSPAGAVIIRGGQILFSNSGIDANGNPGGVVDIGGESLTLDGATMYLLNYWDADHPGTAFQAAVSGDFVMKNESLIDTSAMAAGRGGDILISAGSIRLGDDAPGTGVFRDFGMYGFIQSWSFGAGKTGNISLTAGGDLTIRNGFYVNTAALDAGNAGDITVSADSVRFYDQGNISSNAFAFGKGGIVDITARDVLLSAANREAVVNSSQITGIGAQAGGLSDGGAIRLRTDTLQILDGGQISTVLFGSGRGADIDISSRNVLISGYALDSTLTPVPYCLSGIDGRLVYPSATGTGGNINITADSLALSMGGVIRTSLFEDAPGKAGNIGIQARTMDLRSGGQVYADSYLGTGDSGDIAVSAGSISVTGFGTSQAPYPVPGFTGFSTTTNAGRGGTILLSAAGDFSLSNGGGIKSDTQGSGLGGTISIGAQDVTLTDGAAISSSSVGSGNAGNVNITAGNSVTLRSSMISTEALLSDGGNISISAPGTVSLFESRITASVGGGAQTVGGNIVIDPQFVILRNGQITANAYEGQGGNIQIVSNTFLADPNSVVDASSALGIDGTVNILATNRIVSGLLNPLPSDYVSATSLLREQCMARLRGGKYSSFIIGSRDGLPSEPGNPMPGLLH